MIFDSRSGKIKTKITGSKWFERKEDIKQMRLPQIINSLLETDMYKFSMGQTIFHQFTSYKTTWTFKCRNKDVHFTDEMVEEIKEQVQAFCQLRFTEEELEYLDNITWIKGTYVDFLRLWQPRYEEFTITTDAPCGLAIDAAGTWLNTSMYEIPVLAKIPIDPSIASKVDEGLEPGMFYALTYTITDLARQGRPIHPDTVDAYNWVLERRG